MVSYNTRELTLIALQTLFANTNYVEFDVVVWDNASHDGSADAIAREFPNVDLIRSETNVGFAAANNAVATQVNSPFILLLNPDTETRPGAIASLLSFAKANPEAGIVGGRTVFPDGSLNIASCWNRMTIWSLFCRATGLSRVFARSNLFNSEAIGAWKRDTPRDVDIVVGCLMMIRKDLWDSLGGFREKYFMFGEETDLCLRAAKLGYQPKITPEAEIVHHVGASYAPGGERIVKVLKGRVTLIRDHWARVAQPIGIGLLLIGAAVRGGLPAFVSKAGSGRGIGGNAWREAYTRRDEWLSGY